MIHIAKENIITEECSFDDNINSFEPQVPHDISFVVTQPGEGGSSVTLGAHRFTLIIPKIYKLEKRKREK